MIRIQRGRPLTKEEVAKYNGVRRQIEGELPDLIARYHARMAISESESSSH